MSVGGDNRLDRMALHHRQVEQIASPQLRKLIGELAGPLDIVYINRQYSAPHDGREGVEHHEPAVATAQRDVSMEKLLQHLAIGDAIEPGVHDLP